MRLRDGFLLFDVALYAAIATMSFCFFITALRAYIAWRQHSQSCLTTVLYHRRAFAILQKDLYCAHDTTHTKDCLRIHCLRLGKTWKEEAYIIEYFCKNGGIYRRKQVGVGTEQARQSTLKITPTPAVIDCTFDGNAYVLAYRIEGHKPWMGVIAPFNHREC